MNRYVMVDVETDGPVPGEFSMLQLGAVVVEPGLSRRFFGEFAPISPFYHDGALSVTGITREQSLTFPDASFMTSKFDQWLSECGFDVDGSRYSKDSPIFISDNNGFDFAFVNYYMWKFLKRNPFGHSSRNLGDLYKGCVNSVRENFKHLRITQHTHNPLDDALGNAEALLQMIDHFNIRGILSTDREYQHT